MSSRATSLSFTSPHSNPLHAARGIYRVLLVDSHPLIGEGLRGLLSGHKDLQYGGQAHNERHALEVIRRLPPDVVILDLTLSSGSGLDLIKRLQGDAHKLRTLVYSSHDEVVYAERCLHAGAMGYLSKNEDPAKLIDAIRCVIAGYLSISPELQNRLIGAAIDRRDHANESPVECLTDRELDVLDLTGHGQPPREIADKLNISVKTVQSHREHIKEKLHLKSSGELNIYAAEWILEDDAQHHSQSP